MTDQEVYNAIVSRKLTPGMVGLRQFEVRFHGDINAYHRTNSPDYCDLVSQLWTDKGRAGNYMHCENSATDIPGDFIEGIGGEYDKYVDGYVSYYPTVSYLSDDPDLYRRIEEVLRRARIAEMLFDE